MTRRDDQTYRVRPSITGSICRPAKRIDELGDFLEWLANAKPEDEQTIRAEINRYWGSVGDIQAVSTLNYMLSQVLKPGTTRRERQQILELIDKYSRYDPAEVAQFYDQLFDSILLLFPGMPRRAGGPKQKPTVLNPGVATSAAEQAAADKAAWDTMNWDDRGRYFEDRAGRTLHRNFPVIDKIPDGIATSIKSMDFRAATYQKTTPFTYRLKLYVGEASEFVGGELGKDVVQAFGHRRAGTRGGHTNRNRDPEAARNCRSGAYLGQDAAESR
jgi:hypothetical protein